MTQTGKAVIDQQKGTEAGASGDDLGAPFSLPAPSEERTYSPPLLAGGGMACGHRAPSGGRGRTSSTISFPLPVYTADANGGLCIGRSCADHRGLGGGQPPTSERRYIPVHCLLLLSTSINEG